MLAALRAEPALGSMELALKSEGLRDRCGVKACDGFILGEHALPVVAARAVSRGVRLCGREPALGSEVHREPPVRRVEWGVWPGGG